MGGSWYRRQHVALGGGQFPVRQQKAGELLLFTGAGHLPKNQQPDDLQKGAIDQFSDVIAAITQLADGALHVRNGCLSHHQTFQDDVDFAHTRYSCQ